MNEELYTAPIDSTEWNSYSDLEYLRHAFDDSDDHGDAYKLCLRYASRISEMLATHIGIRLHGEVGTGKTFYASAIASYAYRLGFPIRWIDCKTFLSEMTDFKSRNDEYIRNVLDARILVIDDFDTAKLNSLELSCLFRLTNAREGKLTIVTTNMTPTAITGTSSADMDEKRALSRLQALCPVAVVLTGRDRRKDVATQKRRLAEQIMRGTE